MAEALAFYRGPLEFTLDGGGDDATNSSLTRGDARVMIETAADHFGDEYNAAIKERLGVLRRSRCTSKLQIWPRSTPGSKQPAHKIVDPLAERPWGQEEFTVEDHEGNWLTFWKKLG